ncbi:MAG: phosphoribosyl-AMP cyclohydrolase [Actinobacteria bacterium HGW-Actinobacteria-1]|jgi:phosphoribosyl-AMP cyclohydrolase|nr:MAG: phosphoribosyl-AMP cyclohydrolase [Actinobacteria bacterium HGW-Actinobacteria-1]
MESPELIFDERGLIPAVVQQYDTLEVLMVAWMNAESLQRTIESGRTWFWSRSRQELWNKGESSGHIQIVKEIRYDCDADTLLVLVDQTGAACHTGEHSCFYRTMFPAPGTAAEAADENTDSVPLS